MMRVLVADDEAPARGKLQRWLSEQPDIEVVAEAEDGLRAAEAIERLKPEVAFLDIQMPGLSGLEVAAQLEQETAPLIVFVTAFDEHAIKAFELNAIDYLLKPYDKDRLLKTLSRIRARPADGSARAAVTTARAQTQSHDRLLVPVGETLQSAYRENPALAALVEEQQRLEATASSLRRSRLPRFEGGAAIDWTNSDVVEPTRIGSGFVGFTWDLGLDGRREAEIAEAQEAVDRNRVAIEAELRDLEEAVRATQGAVEERLAALASAEAAVGQAEENLRIREQQFGAGRAASEDVLDAEALLAGQRATLATALYQAHTRRAELQQVLGLPLDAILPAPR